MQGFGHFSHASRSRTTQPSLLGSSERLTIAAKVLGDVRALGNACRARRLAIPMDRGNAVSLDTSFQAYEDGRWADAFDAAAGLADAGDACAAKLALLMLRHGEQLYGVGFSAEPCRIARWAKRVLQTTAELHRLRGEAHLPARRSSASHEALQRTPRSTSRRTASPNSITAIA